MIIICTLSDSTLSTSHYHCLIVKDTNPKDAVLKTKTRDKPTVHENLPNVIVQIAVLADAVVNFLETKDCILYRIRVRK